MTVASRRTATSIRVDRPGGRRARTARSSVRRSRARDSGTARGRRGPRPGLAYYRLMPSLITVEIVYNDIGYNDEPDITTEL